MKQATGELNMTVFVVVAVGVLLAFFYTVFWPMIKNNLTYTQNCNNAVCDETSFDKNTGKVNCQHYDKDDNAVGNEFKCAWRG